MNRAQRVTALKYLARERRAQRMNRAQRIKALMDFYGCTRKEAVAQLKDMGDY